MIEDGLVATPIFDYGVLLIKGRLQVTNDKTYIG